MHTTHSGTEKLNMLAAGMMTALSLHGLFCLAAMPAAIAAPHDTIALAVLKLLRVLWNLAGIGSAAYLIFQTVGMIHGRNHKRARLGALGAIFLPLLGSPGAVTAFALLPLGIFATWLLKQADWQILFQDQLPAEMAVEGTEFAEEEMSTSVEV